MQRKKNEKNKMMKGEKGGEQTQKLNRTTATTTDVWPNSSGETSGKRLSGGKQNEQIKNIYTIAPAHARITEQR